MGPGPSPDSSEIRRKTQKLPGFPESFAIKNKLYGSVKSTSLYYSIVLSEITYSLLLVDNNETERILLHESFKCEYHFSAVENVFQSVFV